MIYAMGGSLAKQLETRAGQCVLTRRPGLFVGIEGGKPIPLQNLRYFGDGFQISKNRW